MKLLRNLVVLPVLSLLIISPGWTQVAKGRYELALEGGHILKDDLLSSPAVSFDKLSFGYFIGQRLEVGSRLDLFVTKGWKPLGRVTPFFFYYFPEGPSDRVVPYVGGGYGRSFDRGKRDRNILEYAAGVKLFSRKGGWAFWIGPLICQSSSTIYRLHIGMSIFE